MHTFTITGLAAAFLALAHAQAASISFPEKDQRGKEIVTLNTRRSFPAVESKADWQRRAQAIREQVLVSCGLWPLPERTPLNAQIFGRIERDGYSVEKVYFESYPGFFVAGNLYRPLGKGNGPFPAMLNPHGHWNNGRLADERDGSIAARCISFARQGIVAFSWDMIGYNDTQFAGHTNAPGYKTHRHFANDLTNQLWGISQMGLQTWNAIRALDFIVSLPEVNPAKVACTGESGGGTQTFMLGAIDERLVAQAPIVMVSHSMQGGCSCENVAGLRVDYSNMEISAQPAPRPQMLVGATGDWTRAVLTVEGPEIEKVYKLFKAEDRFDFVRFDYNHNYNQTSREAVYGFFNRWLLGGGDSAPITEPPYKKEPDADLRVFPDGKLPPNAVTEEQLTAYLIRSATNDWWTYAPVNPPLLDRYRKQMIPAWKRSLQVDFIERGLMVQPGQITKGQNFTVTRVTLGRAGKGDRVNATLVTPRRDTLRTMVVLAHADGQSKYLDAKDAPQGLARLLVEQNVAVLIPDLFQTGTNAAPARDYTKDFFTTYNRTEIQERVQDLVTACAFAQTHGKGRRVLLCGEGRAGLWAMLAAPAADGIVADCNAFDSTDDRNFLARDLFSPGLRKLGGFEGVLAINTSGPLLLHNLGDKFTTAYLRHVYKGMHVPERYREEKVALGEEQVAEWISKLRL